MIEETREPSGVPDDLDLGGETITVWCSAGAYKNICTELTGDILDDVIYNNTLKAQEKLNCRIEYHDANGADSHTDISTIFLADDTTYDLYLPKQWNGGKLVMEGLYLNLYDAPYLSLDKPWWNKHYIDNMTISNDRIFTLIGDYSINYTAEIGCIYCCIYYNKQMYEDFWKNPDGLYDIVNAGEWTLDKMGELCEAVFLDINNDGKTDRNDRLGALQCWNNTSLSMAYSAGISVTERDKDNIPILAMDTEHNFDIIEKINDLLHNTPGLFYTGKEDYVKVSTTAMEQTERFINGNVLFFYGSMGTSSTLREMESDYGVIPYPKMDTA